MYFIHVQTNVLVFTQTIFNVTMLEKDFRTDKHILSTFQVFESNILCVRKYIINKNYIQSFGDIVLLILCNALQTKLTILNEKGSDQCNIVTVTPYYLLTTHRSITIHRKGDHYNGVVPMYHETDTVPETPELYKSITSKNPQGYQGLGCFLEPDNDGTPISGTEKQQPAVNMVISTDFVHHKSVTGYPLSTRNPSVESRLT